MLPIDNPKARTVLVRGCTSSPHPVTQISPRQPPPPYFGPTVTTWVFVEGTEKSLDKPLYSLLFPNVAVIAKSNCRDVEVAVSGIRGAADLHWIHAFGIIDNDRRTQAGASLKRPSNKRHTSIAKRIAEFGCPCTLMEERVWGV
jgi:hypothetical protein